MFSNASHALLSAAFESFLKSGSWKICFTWGLTKMPQTLLHYTKRPSNEKYSAMFNCLFLYNDTFTPFLEGSTAEALIQVAEPWFWGGPNPKIGFTTQPEWWSVALWYCKLKNLGLLLYLTHLLVKPLPILVLSPEYNFLVALAMALSHHEGWVSIPNIYWGYSILCLDFPQKQVVLVMQK